MPEAERGATAVDSRDSEGGWRELGAITYHFTGKETLLDFNRTAGELRQQPPAVVDRQPARA